MKKMLKKLTVLTVICLALAVTAAAAAPMTSHTVEALDLELALPETVTVLDREAGDGVYLEFTLTEPKKDEVFYGTVAAYEPKPALSDYAFDYSPHYDSWYEDFKDEEQELIIKFYDKFLGLFNQKGYRADASLYENDFGTFMETVVRQTVDGKSCRMTTYTFESGGKSVAISFVSAGRNHTGLVDDIMETVCADRSVWSASGFADVAGHWAEDAITEAVEKKLFDGTGRNTFSPDDGMTRAMLVQVLYRMEKEPRAKACDFIDVSPYAWYADAVAWAAEEEIVQGSNGLFRPNDPVTREQLAAILWRYAKSNREDVSVGEDTNILSYEDAFDISEYAIPAFQWACGAGLLNGVGEGYLAPQDTTTRAQVAAILVRYLDVY